MFKVKIQYSDNQHLQTGFEYKLIVTKKDLSLRASSVTKSAISWQWGSVKNHSVYQPYYSLEVYNSKLGKYETITLTSQHAGPIYKAVQKHMHEEYEKAPTIKEEMTVTGDYENMIKSQKLREDTVYEILRIEETDKKSQSKLTYEYSETGNNNDDIIKMTPLTTLSLNVTYENLHTNANKKAESPNPRRKNRGRPYKEFVQLLTV